MPSFFLSNDSWRTLFLPNKMEDNISKKSQNCSCKTRSFAIYAYVFSVILAFWEKLSVTLLWFSRKFWVKYCGPCCFIVAHTLFAWHFERSAHKWLGVGSYKPNLSNFIVMRRKIVRFSVTFKINWAAFKNLQQFIYFLSAKFWKHTTKPRLILWNFLKTLEKQHSSRQNLGMESLILII